MIKTLFETFDCLVFIRIKTKRVLRSLEYKLRGQRKVEKYFVES